MKRSLPSMVAGVVLVLILGLYMVTYRVRSTEVAVVKTFGRATPESVVTESGLKLRWPWPIQAVDHYDNRVQTTSITGEETSTNDKKTVIVSTSVGWRIGDPFKFSLSCRDQKAAEESLRTLTRDKQKTVISSYSFGNLVSVEPGEMRFDEIEKGLLDTVKQPANDLFGIKVESVRMDRLALPSKVCETVFEAMKKERQAQADKYTSEGQAEAERIKKEAEGIASTISTFADRKAAEFEAEGRAASVAANATFSKDQALEVFLLKLKSLEAMLKDRATIVLDAEQPPFDLIPEKPPMRASAKDGPTTRPADLLMKSAVSAGPEMTEQK